MKKIFLFLNKKFIISRKSCICQQKGSALLYSILLMSTLIIISQLVFSYIIFSVKSRRQSYNYQANYWSAWGGVEASLVKIKEYQEKQTAWCVWPENSHIEDEENFFQEINYSSDKTYDKASIDLDQKKDLFVNRVNSTYLSLFKNNSSKKFNLNSDESLLFDLVKFGGDLNFEFIPSENPEEESQNLIWIRAKKDEEVYEGLLHFVPETKTFKCMGSLFHNPSDGEKESCSELSGSYEKPIILSSSDGTKINFAMHFTSGDFQFFKIKIFKGSLSLEFKSYQINVQSALGLPYTIIHSIGYHAGEKVELYVKFPNQLQTITDVLDYSLYQADF